MSVKCLNLVCKKIFFKQKIRIVCLCVKCVDFFGSSKKKSKKKKFNWWIWSCACFMWFFNVAFDTGNNIDFSFLWNCSFIEKNTQQFLSVQKNRMKNENLSEYFVLLSKTSKLSNASKWNHESEICLKSLKFHSCELMNQVFKAW